MNPTNYAAALSSLRAELAQEQFCLANQAKYGAPRWAIRNTKKAIAEIGARINKVADLSFAASAR
jgi:ribosomal protein L29